jgi:hypothetical protein
MRRATVTDYRELAGWWALSLWFLARLALAELWRTIPGPRWVKVIVMAVFIACLIMPGQADEIVLIALIRLARWTVDRVQSRRA